MTGPEIKEFRTKLGWNQTVLAKVLGVHLVTLGKWERGIAVAPPFLDLALFTIEHVLRRGRGAFSQETYEAVFNRMHEAERV